MASVLSGVGLPARSSFSRTRIPAASSELLHTKVSPSGEKAVAILKHRKSHSTSRRRRFPGYVRAAAQPVGVRVWVGVVRPGVPVGSVMSDR